MTLRMNQFLTGLSRKQRTAGCCRRVGLAISGSYLTFLYLFIKVMYVTNAVGQLFLLNAFLSTDFHLYGFDVMTRMIRGEEWTTSTRFPRVTLCDFLIRKLGNVNRYTVQCALPMNLFYEMMFIFLWFWMVFVLFVTVGSLLQWIYASLFFRFQEFHIRDALVEMDRVIAVTSATGGDVDPVTRAFIRGFLRRDGCFIVRLVSKNAGQRIAGDLVAGLWDKYAESEQGTIREENGRRDSKPTVIEMQNLT